MNTRSIKVQFLIFVVLPLCWGSAFLATKLCLVDLSPIWLGAIRHTLSSTIFLTVLLSKGGVKSSLREFKSHWLLFFSVGIVGTFLAAFFQNMGLRFTTASVSSLINTLEPVLVAMMSVIILRESLSRAGIIGLIIAFVGGCIVITNGNPSTLFQLDGQVKGNLLILLLVISNSLYTILTKVLVGKTKPLYAVTFSGLIGTLALVISALVLEDFPTLSHVSPTTWLWVIYLAVFPTCFSLFLYNKLLTKIPASRVSVILFLIPLYGVLLGILFLGEPLSKAMIYGGFLTLVGVWLVEYRPAKVRQKLLEGRG